MKELIEGHSKVYVSPNMYTIYCSDTVFFYMWVIIFKFLLPETRMAGNF